ncbi:MAG TPA: general secretion pathway protein GspB, partial [Burkholderiaceae bacterium]
VAAAAASANRVYAVNELPDDIRRQLPVITVGGSMYSSTPANRILIVNGQVLHEGDRIAPELVLQQIKVKAAVLAFRGYRYEIAF